MRIDLTKTLSMNVPHGYLTVDKIPSKDQWGNDKWSWQVTYHNNIYQNSPFKLNPTFSNEFTLEEVVNSSEIRSAVKQITGETFNRV